MPEELEPVVGSPNPFKGIAGWIIGLLLSLVSFFFFLYKDGKDKKEAELQEQVKYQTSRADLWREKYFDCKNEVSVLDVYKQFGVLPGRKTLTIAPSSEGGTNIEQDEH